MVSLSFQLPAIDGLGTDFLILRVIFFLSALSASLTALVSRSPAFEADTAGGAGRVLACCCRGVHGRSDSPFRAPFVAILLAAEGLGRAQKLSTGRFRCVGAVAIVGTACGDGNMAGTMRACLVVLVTASAVMAKPR